MGTVGTVRWVRYAGYGTVGTVHMYLPVLNHQKTCFSFLLKLDNFNHINLVGGFNPSENMSLLGLFFPIYGKIKKCSKPSISFLCS